MNTGRFLVIALAGGVVAGAMLALATALDEPIFYIPALLAVLGILIAREGWLWEGDWRGWLIMMGTLSGAILIAFLFQRVTS